MELNGGEINVVALNGQLFVELESVVALSVAVSGPLGVTKSLGGAATAALTVAANTVQLTKTLWANTPISFAAAGDIYLDKPLVGSASIEMGATGLTSQLFARDYRSLTSAISVPVEVKSAAVVVTPRTSVTPVYAPAVVSDAGD